MDSASPAPLLLWFRQDLRLQDNAALEAALRWQGPIIPVYIWSPEDEGEWAPGEAQQWWLYQALPDLDRSLQKYGSRLILRSGEAERAIPKLVEETGAGAVYWNRRYEPLVTDRDSRIKQDLLERGVKAKSFNSSLLFEPWMVSTGQGKPYQVFTPFWKNVTRGVVAGVVEVELDLLAEQAPEVWPSSLSVDALSLLPDIPWYKGIAEAWTPGEGEAQRLLAHFLQAGGVHYKDQRDIPGKAGTSKLSPYLHFGHIGPRQIWAATVEAGIDQTVGGKVFLKEVGWREFAYHVMFHFPYTIHEPLRSEYKEFPWKAEDAVLKAWQSGKTGYPLVDAGMRQLWKEGWMHNRVRMVVASLLVKHLLHDWKAGAEWFWDTLVDADLASNSLGWQWAGGCGADAAPYFRIFNPVTQGMKFDPDGTYIRSYVPELAKLDVPYIHEPWVAPDTVLRAAGIRLGDDYPLPIVEQKAGRQRALDALAKFKEMTS